MNQRWGMVAFAVWQLGSLFTFVKLTFFDDYIYTWWNWLVAIPVNALLGEIWPIYWLILRPLT